MIDRLIDATEAVLVVIDVQERLAAAMSSCDTVVSAISRLVRAAHELEMPVIYTEQYPRGLGTSVPELADALVGAYGPVEKVSFDACNESAFVSALEATGRRQVVLVGMEMHICVAQTALHLLEDGYRVHVVADAVCSAEPSDGVVALERLRAAGAEVSVSESVIYEALGEAGTDRFRSILAIIKERSPAE